MATAAIQGLSGKIPMSKKKIIIKWPVTHWAETLMRETVLPNG